MDNTVLWAAVTAVLCYLLGSVNSSIILSKTLSGEDIRKSGSGNAGATNMLRTHGKKMGVITLILDVLKGVIAILIARAFEAMFFIDGTTVEYIAAAAVVLGHDFPLFFGFKGGKGVATSLGVVMMLDWKIGLIILICALAVMALTRYVSLGSVLGGAAFIVGEIVKTAMSQTINPVQLICALIIGGLLIARHHANIVRLWNGTENKLGEKKNKPVR